MSIKRTIITTIVALALVAVVAPIAVNAQTPTIAQLLQQIASLQTQLQGLQGTTPAATGTGACAGITFTRNLVVGSTGSDVKCLQVLLNNNGYKVATTGAGSPGYETTTFGPRTLAAVKLFQAAKGFTPANQVGPMTRGALNALLGTTGTTGTTGVTTPTGSISAMLASDNPPSGAIVGGQAQADLMHINFTGTGTITSVTLQRSGISDSSLFSAVYLYDGNARITSGYSFNTTGVLTMNGLSIPVNGLHEISVRGDVSANACGTTPASTIACESTAVVTLTGFTANGSTASANVMGNSMVVASGSLATANLTTYSPGSTTINSGAVNQTLWSRTISISPRAVSFYGLTVKMIGSAPANTLANVALYVDGTQVSTATFNTNNQYVFSLSSPSTLSTGSHLLEVRGDVVAGSSRSFYLSLEQGSDISLKDSQLGIFITTTNASAQAVNVNSDTFTINSSTTGGSVTIQQDPNFTATTLVSGASNVTLGSFNFTAYGEDEKITELDFYPVFTTLTPADTGSSHTLTNVGLYVNGGQVGSNVTATDLDNTGTPVTAGTEIKFANLGSNLIVPAGTSVTVSIKGDVIGTGGVNPTSGTVEFYLAGGSNNAQGQSSELFGSTTAQAGQSLSVSSTNVTFAAAAGFFAPQTGPNTPGVHIGSFAFQAGSAEGATITNIAVTFPTTGSGNTMLQSNDLTNLVVKVNGTPVGTTIGLPQDGTNTNNFSANVPVAVSGAATIDVYADLGSLTGSVCGTSSNQACTVTPSALATYRGSTSNVTNYTNSNVATAGVQTTSASGSLTAAGTSLDTDPSSTTSASWVQGGIGAGAKATFNLVASNAPVTIQELKFFVTDSTASGYASVAGITLGSGSQYTPIAGLADITSIPAAYQTATTNGLDLPITITYSPVGTSGINPGTTAKIYLAYVKYLAGSTTKYLCATIAGVQTCPGSAVALSGSGVVAPQSGAIYLTSSVPTVTLASTGNPLNTAQYSTTDVAKVTVTGGAQAMRLRQIEFTVGFGGGTAGALSNGDTTHDYLTAGGSVVAYCKAATSGSTVTCVFTGGGAYQDATNGTYANYGNDYKIPANTPVTFDLVTYLGTAISGGTTYTESVSLTRATSTATDLTGFQWDDTSVGGTATSNTGTFGPYNDYYLSQIQNAGSASVHN